MLIHTLHTLGQVHINVLALGYVAIIIFTCFIFSIVQYFTVPPAPMNPGVVRVNAEQIQVHWTAVMRRDYRQPITHYTVKYYPLNMEVQSAYKMINTSNTEIIISSLDPVRMYAVSIAANSEAGRGNFSKEIIAGCKYHQRGDFCGKNLNPFHIWSSCVLHYAM